MPENTPSDQNDRNLLALHSALIQIRSEAGKALGALRRDPSDLAEALNAIKLVEEIADRMHNVPSMLMRGIECNAMHLLNVGVDESWPTGITSPKEVTASVHRGE